MKLYKLTDQDGYTREGEENETLWDIGVTHQALEPGNTLCTPQVIHAYITPEIAILFNPIHADIKNPLLWEAEGEVVIEDHTKVGVKKLTTLKTIDNPDISIEQKVRFSIFCAFKVYKEQGWVTWAQNWLLNKNRTSSDANAAASAAYAGGAAANTAAAYAAASAAYAGASAAHAGAAAASAAYAAANAANAGADIKRAIELALYQAR